MELGEKVLLIKDKACKTSSRKKNKLHWTWRLQDYVGRHWRLDHALHKVGAVSLYVLRSFPCTISEGATHTAPGSRLPAALLHLPSAPHQQPSIRPQLAASTPPSWCITWLDGGCGPSAWGGTWSWLTVRSPGRAGSHPAKSRAFRWAEIGRGVRKLRLLIGSEKGAGTRGPASGPPGSSFACNLLARPPLGQPGGNLRWFGLGPVAARLLPRAAGIVERWQLAPQAWSVC